MSEFTQFVGFTAATSLIITLLPQIYHTYKSKQVDDLSYFFIILNLITSFLFFLYGSLLKELPIIIANIFLILQNSTLLVFKRIYSNNNHTRINNHQRV